MEQLRYYLALDDGLRVMQTQGDGVRIVGEFFAGQSLDDIIGSRTRPEVVFAALPYDGAYRTRDAGKTWEKVMDGDVRTFTIDPHDDRVVYLGTGPIGLYRSEDGGSTWEPLAGLLDVPSEAKTKWGAPPSLAGNPQAVPHVRYIFVHPDDPSLLFVLLEHGGVLLSRDRGKTWTDRSDGIDYVDMHVIANFPGSTERYYVSSARGFFRTDDCGAHWYRAENGMPWGGSDLVSYSHDWYFVPAEPPRMVVCYGRGSPGVWGGGKADPGGHIVLSDDGAANWRAAGRNVDQRSMPWTLARHPTDPRTIYCGTGGLRGFVPGPMGSGNGAFYRSRDAGESWEVIIPELPTILEAWVAPL